jgi:hypothetical protein
MTGKTRRCIKLALAKASSFGLGASGVGFGQLHHCGRQKEGRREARRKALRREPLFKEAGHRIQTLFDEGQALAYAAQVLLCVERPSNILLQNGHSSAVGRRRGLEEGGIRHGNGRFGSKTSRQQGRQPLRFLAQRQRI